jgi:hypothetical protein
MEVAIQSQADVRRGGLIRVAAEEQLRRADDFVVARPRHVAIRGAVAV